MFKSGIEGIRKEDIFEGLMFNTRILLETKSIRVFVSLYRDDKIMMFEVCKNSTITCKPELKYKMKYEIFREMNQEELTGLLKKFEDIISLY